MRDFKPELTPRPRRGPCAPLNGIDSKLDLEIGSGSGEFACDWVKKSGRGLIAIEKSRARFLKFQRLREREGRPSSLWPVNTNAVWWLAHYGRPNMFERIFLLYPNPYPKSRQSHLRWINRPFMPFLLSLLKPGGFIELRTNEYYYYREFKEKIRQWDFMSIAEDKALRLDKPGRFIEEAAACEKGRAAARAFYPQSLFEKKYLERGELCRRLSCRKA